MQSECAFVPASEDVPTYFLPMLNDVDRNVAYESAIIETIQAFKRAEGRPPHVLDLGSGSGMLSIIALTNGADRVTLVEANASLAEISKTELEAAYPGTEGTKWNLLNTLSLKLKAPGVGGTVYDMVISELVGSMINSESMGVYLYDLLSRGVVKNFGKAGETPKFYVVPESGTMTLRAYWCPCAAGLVTGIKYAPMDNLYRCIYNMEPTSKVEWSQDESMKVCITSSTKEAASGRVEVLKELYNTTIDTVSYPRAVELSIDAPYQEQPKLARVVLVLEWHMQLSPGTKLVHTVDHVGSLEPQVQLARWVNWGFLFSPLASCAPPSADGRYNFSVQWAPADLILKAQRTRKPGAARTSNGAAAPSTAKEASQGTVTAASHASSDTAPPAAPCSKDGEKEGCPPVDTTSGGARSTSGSGEARQRTKRMRIAPTMVHEAAPAEETSVVTITEAQLKQALARTKAMVMSGLTSV